MGRIIVKNHMDNCLTNEQGLTLKRLINKENTPITVDFSGIDGVTTSFVNSSFVDLFYLKGIEYIKSIKIINSSKQINATILGRIKFEKDNMLMHS